MKHRKVIKRSNFPTRLPVISTAIIYLLLKECNAPDWLWGAVGAIMLIIWVTSFWFLIIEEDVDIFSNGR